jgi:hypothetical protein
MASINIVAILIFIAVIAALISLLAIIIPAISSSVLAQPTDLHDIEYEPVTKQVWGVGLVAPAPIILIGVFMIGVIILLRIK